MAADHWVPTYNALIRGMAQGYGLPFLNLYEAMDPLENHGLSGDGLHLNKGPYGVCDFSEDALGYGYNMRNLIALQSLDRVKKVLVDREPGLDETVVRLQGSGGTEDPFIIESLPFTDYRDTQRASQREFEAYECDDADESGPEFVYQLVLDRETALRIMVMDRDSVDIDIHLLDEDLSCIERAHQQMDRFVPAGTYYITADSWVNGEGVEQSGPYQLLVVECDVEDVSCQ